MTVRITWARAAGAIVAALAALAAAMLFAWSGLFNVAASSGHWPVTAWFLHWTMQNSVRTHAAFQTPQIIRDDRSLVSAGHFAQSCAGCHGAPGVRPLPVMQRAMPPAPDLAVNARRWTDRRLFWILDHGVKYSGMPAWGAPERPDEIARMVGFVRRLPRMAPATYRRLTTIHPAGADAFARCAGCHGADGQGRGQRDIPILGGQKPAYLESALLAYATGTRHSGVMRQAAAILDAPAREVLARRFAAMPGLRAGEVEGGSAAAAVITRGLPRNQLPACQSCHDPAGLKNYPVLRGQRASYIAQRLRQWRAEEGMVDARQSQSTMPVIARRIPEAMIDPIAALLAGEPPS